MPKETMSRRTFMKTTAVAAAVVGTGVSFSRVFGLRTVRAAAEDDVQTIINIAATAEAFATTHYYRALMDLGDLDPVTTKYLQAGLAAEYLHLQFLESNGAEPLTLEFYFPQGTFADKKTLGAVTAIAETVFVAAYLAATRRFAELDNPLLAATAAQVAVVEGQHLLFMRQLAGEPVSNNIGLGEALFFNVSEAVPVVAPLLEGTGQVGGLDVETSAYKFPEADAINAAIGDNPLKDVKPFTAMEG